MQGPGADAALADALDAIPSSSAFTSAGDHNLTAEAVWSHVKSTGKQRGAETHELLAPWLVCNTCCIAQIANSTLNK